MDKLWTIFYSPPRSIIIFIHLVKNYNGLKKVEHLWQILLTYALYHLTYLMRLEGLVPDSLTLYIGPMWKTVQFIVMIKKISLTSYALIVNVFVVIITIIMLLL